MKEKTGFKHVFGGFLTVILLLLGFRAAADALLPSSSPPGNLLPAQTPQLVLLTFDDSVTTGSYALVQQVLTNHFNPNGHPIKATFFVSLDGNYDPASIRKLYDAGHEIGVHTMSHATSENSSLGRWQQEIGGARRTLAKLCGIPSEEIVGFRAPFLKTNNNAFRVLFKRGFLYDSSFPEKVSGLSASPASLIWPYTLDHGLAQAAPAAYAPTENYPGLFEIPLWAQFTNATSGVTMDPPETFASNDVVRLWQTNFLARYQGNRAPYGLFLHATTSSQWLSNPAHSAWRAGALRAFISWALAQPDTWFVTCRDLVGFMNAPVPAWEAAGHPSFQTPEREPFPTSAVSRCSYPGSHTFSVCGACPPVAPAYTNAYFGLVPVSGGAVSLNVVSQDAQYAWCVMAVSNDTPSALYDWTVNFTLAGGTVQSLYDATWAAGADGAIRARARQYNSQLAAGGARLLSFRVRRSGGAVAFSDASVAVSGLGQQPVRLGLRRLPDAAGWKLSWDDQALSYSVERATTLASPDWTVITNDISRIEITEPDAPDGGARFYRVKATLETPE